MNKLEKIAFWIVLAVVFLMPVAFLSPSVIPLDMLKASIFSIGTAVSFILVLISAIHYRKIHYPKGPLAYSVLAIVLAFIASGIAQISTGGIYKSFIGAGNETTTVLFVLLCIAFVYTIVTIVKTRERVLGLLSTVIVGGVILGVFHIMRLAFGADVFTFGGLFSTQVSNTLGQWNDLGVYFGFILLVSYLGLELMLLSKSVRILLYVSGVIAFILTAIVGFASVWYALAVVVFLVGLYTRKHSKLSKNTIVLFVLVLAFAVFNTAISEKLAVKFGINQIDVRPSWELSTDIGTQTLSRSPIFGAGPNRYVNEYLRTKPASINQTVFWAIDFNSGVSYLTSFAVTLGLVGIVAILFFLLSLVKYSIKVYRHSVTDPIHKFILATGTVTTLYGVILSILYTPSYSITVLGSVIFSLFIIGLHQEGIITYGNTEGASSQKALLVKGIAIIGVVIAVLALIFFVRRTIAAHYYQNALVLAAAGNYDEAEKYVDYALEKVNRELYLQGKTELTALRISRSLPNVKESDPKSIEDLKKALEDGVSVAHKLVQLDPLNYQNYSTQAKIYESVIPARVAGSYDNAMKSYASAATLNPGNPSIYLLAAQVELAMGKNAEAKAFIGRALQVKNNYSDAIFLLSQIQVSERSIKDAITSLLVLAQLNPQDPTIFFQLGLLYYNEGDNVNTGLALSRAVELNPEYSNARYFLGLSLARLGKYKEAADQFAEVQKFNPDNEEVAQILTALRAGRSPFQAVSSPERAKTPPVKDTIDKKTTPKVKTR